MPFKPYDLRHCWAVRALRFGVPVSLAAKWMGHSVDIHTKTYQAWISREMEAQVYEQSLRNPNCPQAPIVKQVEVEVKAKKQLNLGVDSSRSDSDLKEIAEVQGSDSIEGCQVEATETERTTPSTPQTQASLSIRPLAD